MLRNMLHVLQGMSLMDFYYVRDQVWKAGEGDLRENNTILLQPEQSRFAELRTEADAALLKSSLDEMVSERVVYLGMFPAILSQLPGGLQVCHARHSLQAPALVSQRPLPQSAVLRQVSVEFTAFCSRRTCPAQGSIHRDTWYLLPTLDRVAGQEVRVRTLGPESKAERKLKEVQESCLDRAFHLSMDRVNYRASDSSQPEAEQQEVLQEIKKLENPEVRPSSKPG